MTNKQRYHRGAAMLAQVHNEFGVPLLKQLRPIAPDFVRFIFEFAYGDIYARPALDMKTRQLATLASLVALNNSPLELKAHIHAALAIGWTREQIIEVIMQGAVYAGFPAAMNALFVAKEAFAERKQTKPQRQPKPRRKKSSIIKRLR